jgi:hypothetical protein
MATTPALRSSRILQALSVLTRGDCLRQVAYLRGRRAPRLVARRPISLRRRRRVATVAAVAAVLAGPSVIVTLAASPAFATTGFQAGAVSTVAGDGSSSTAAGTGTGASIGSPKATAYAGGVVYVAGHDYIGAYVKSSGAFSVLAAQI